MTVPIRRFVDLVVEPRALTTDRLWTCGSGPRRLQSHNLATPSPIVLLMKRRWAAMSCVRGEYLCINVVLTPEYVVQACLP